MTKILMDEATVKLALEALEYIANETYDPWTNGAEAGRIAQTTLSKIKNKCRAIQTSDQMTCECGNVWDMNDPYPPKCTALREAPAGNVKETQKIEHEPAQQEPVAWMTKTGSVWKTKADKTDEPLYTSPPAQRTWVGLTLEHMETTHWSPDFRAGAKWAAAKLKEKNT